jgi:RNA polymerase sigma-70 factor (ECF subfamily)
MKGVGFFRPRLAFSARSRSADPAPAHDQAERFRQLVLPHMDAAYSFARYLTRDPAAAEDVVQEAFLRAFRGFDQWRGEAAKPWLLAIVRNCYLNSVSGTASRTSTHPLDEWTGDLPEALVECDNPESLLADKNEAAMLRATIEQLPEPFRETLILRELEELSYKDIASIAGVPVGTVMSRLARARQMLAALLLPAASRGAQA